MTEQRVVLDQRRELALRKAGGAGDRGGFHRDGARIRERTYLRLQHVRENSAL
jgi:hypothetical protein